MIAEREINLTTPFCVKSMKRFSDFIDFTAEELAANESFQSYLFRTDEKSIAFWEGFMKAHPEKLAEVREASHLLSLLTFRGAKIRAQHKQSELRRLLASISLHEAKAHGREGTRSTFYSAWAQRLLSLPLTRMAAAASAIAVLCFLWLYLPSPGVSDITYQTQYGEKATYVLPDSSIVTLNGNSRLVHRGDWDDDSPREVWLEGEAFFDVTHKSTKENARFIVHIPGMEVEVLGTRFNVFNRHDKANVILNTGKVKVRIASEKDTSSVVMNPDEVLEFSRKDLTVTKKRVKAEVLTSWRNQVLIFENTPLSRIGEMIEHTYGVEVIFTEEVDTTEELAGTVPSEKLETLLNVLAKSSNLYITRQHDQIIISKHDPNSKNH